MRIVCLFALIAGLAARAGAQASTSPSSPPPESHQFDFWLGEWEVFDSKGNHIGDSRIEAFAGGFGVLENWTATNNQGSGKSINSFDPQSRRWHQHWVGSGGGISDFWGGLQEGKMVLVAESLLPQGNKVLNRGTWTPYPDGTVRQEFATSRDGGKTWQPGFNGLYRPKKE